MNQNFVKLVLFLILNFMSIGLSFGRSVGQFCDNNFVDAVLWDGITYRLTRNEWIATVDAKTGTVGPFTHLSDDSFQNEKGYYYQSVYHIPTVPECNEKTASCEMINGLKGLTVYVIRRYRSSEQESYEVIHRIYRNQDMIPAIHNVQDDVNIQAFIESNILPKNSLQKYRPSVYSPKDFTFIHITNQYQNFGPLLETIQLQTNGVIERSYHELNEFKDIVFITSFWWTSQQKLYIIGEHKTGFGKPFIYELELKNNNIVLKPINESVSEFFGCDKPRDNQFEKSIRHKISVNDLGQWSVQTIDTTTAQPQNQTLNDVTDQRVSQVTLPETNQRLVVRPSPKTEKPRSTTPNYHMTDQRMNYRTDPRTEPQYQRTEYKIRPITVSTPIPMSEQRRGYPSVQTSRQTFEPQTDLKVDRRTDRRSEQIYNRTAHVVRPSNIRLAIQSEQTRPQPTPPTTLPIVYPNLEHRYEQKSPQNIVQKHPDQNKKVNMTQASMKTDIPQRTKYSWMEISDFWKMFPFILMLSLLLMATLMLIMGLFAVFNLRNILKSKVKQKNQKTFNGLKNQRIKYNDDFSDFFIEEYDTSPKLIPSKDSHSCQTNDSYESTVDCEPARTVL